MAITVAEINANCIRHNLQQIRRQTNNTPVLAMVKANAYGHSMVDCARVLRKQDVEYLGVAVIDEALALRQAGDIGKILVMVSPEPTDADLFINNSIETAFSSFQILKAFAKRAAERNTKIYGHLYIDTGMNRDGIPHAESLKFMQYIKDNPQIEIIGLMTHLATADMPEEDLADKQLAIFEQVKDELHKNGFHFKYYHAANSSAILNYPKAHYNLVRPGISLYGYMPNIKMAQRMDLQPAMKWKSKVMLIKDVKKGGTVGYGLKYIAPKDTRIAVIPVGYGDGIYRSLSNNFQCLINGKRFDSVGSICMDEFMVDLGNADVNICDEVILLGRQGDNEILPYELADKVNSIPYEITTNTFGRTKKIMINEWIV